VKPAPALAGLIEIRGLGIRRCDFANEGVVGLPSISQAADAALRRFPQALTAQFSGIITSNPVERLRRTAAGYRALTMARIHLYPTFGDC